MRKFLYLMFLNMGLFLLCSSVHAQEITVKGRVTGTNNQPVPGATVTLKGTTRSVVTHQNANFSIRADRGAVLVISSVGFEPREMTASAETMNVQLAGETKSMESVVVTTGFGIQK